MRRLGNLLGSIARGTARGGRPYKLTLILTRRCPTRCRFCSIWKTPSPGELGAAEWDRVFARAPHSAWVNLSGGEIFLRPDLPEILDSLTARMPGLYLVDFPTTGYFPGRILDACRRLVRGGVRRVLVTISLDGPPALHDRLRGRAGAHDRACEAMRTLRQAGLPRVRAYFGMTLLPENHAAVPETIASAREKVSGITARDIHFNLGLESGHYYRNLGSHAQPPGSVLATLESHRRRGLGPVAWLERAYQRRIKAYLEHGRSPVPCTALRASVFVDPQGVVYPCSIYDAPLGDLRGNGYDLGRVLAGARARRAREEVVEERCPGCWSPCEAYQSLLGRLALKRGKRAAAPATRRSTGGSAAAGRTG